MKTINVVIADDSVVYRSAVRVALGGIPGVEVVGFAANGKLALERLAITPVDLLILDLEMPDMDGLQTLAELSRLGHGCKVLVFSSASKRGAEITLEALRLGATDFISKPGPGDDDVSEEPSKRIRERLEPKIKAIFPELSGADFIAAGRSSKYSEVNWPNFHPEAIVIGSSTGGPSALEKLFARIKAPVNCPIFIAQHMPPVFTATLAERLQRLSGIPSCEGRAGMNIENNHIYVAPGGFHMSVKSGSAGLFISTDQGPLINSVRPAVDPLFATAATAYGQNLLGFVLTGMGADGRDGAERIKEAQGAVVIQEESSCVVFGMPGAVMACGAYDRVLNLDQIAALISEKAESGKGV